MNVKVKSISSELASIACGSALIYIIDRAYKIFFWDTLVLSDLAPIVDGRQTSPFTWQQQFFTYFHPDDYWLPSLIAAIVLATIVQRYLLTSSGRAWWRSYIIITVLDGFWRLLRFGPVSIVAKVRPDDFGIAHQLTCLVTLASVCLVEIPLAIVFLRFLRKLESERISKAKSERRKPYASSL